MSVALDSTWPKTARDISANAHDFTWAAFTTPGTNRFLLAVFLANGSTPKAIATFTSPNLTWTRITGAQNIDVTNGYIVEMYWAFAAAVVTGEVITQTDTSGSLYNRRSFVVYSFSGSDASGAGNSNKASGLAAAAPSLAVTSSGAGGYAVAGLPYRQAGTDSPVPDANTTADYYSGDAGSFAFNERTGSRALAAAGSVTLGWTDSPFEDPIISITEVKAAAGGGAAQVPYNNYCAPILTQ